MSMIPPIPVACKQEGRYKAVVHTGHKYDMEGNIYQEGTVLRESGWSDNLITLTGFQSILAGNRSVRVRAVAGIGNTDPEETDTTLQIFRGFSSVFVSNTRTVNATPDLDGYVTVKFAFRFTFNPGSLGSGVINVAEAGMVEYITTPIASTPVLSRGLLVDGAGTPTAVSYDATNEYLDMYWEFTHYIPAEVTGTVSITVDGVPTNYNYVCRPMLLTSYFMRDRADYIPAWGFSVNGDNANPQFSSNITGNNIADVNSSPTGPYVATNTPAIASSTPVTYGSKSRTVTFSWSPSRGNIAGGVRTVCLSGTDLGGGSQSHLFQVQYDPKLPKDSDHVMSLPFVLSMDNK